MYSMNALVFPLSVYIHKLSFKQLSNLSVYPSRFRIPAISALQVLNMELNTPDNVDSTQVSVESVDGKYVAVYLEFIWTAAGTMIVYTEVCERRVKSLVTRMGADGEALTHVTCGRLRQPTRTCSTAFHRISAQL